jgi:carbon monoxide dehydrogenase subunit G
VETETAEISIDRPESDVWPLVGDFGGWGWMPGIESITVDGDVRTINMSGMEIQEKLINLDDENHEITYSIVGGPVPIESHQATVSVTPAGSDGCEVTWSVTAAPDGTAGFLRDIYQGALDALKAKAEG